jgi:hypothetical protein
MPEEILKIMEMLSNWIKLHPELRINNVFVIMNSPNKYKFGVAIANEYYIEATIDAHKIDELYTHYLDEFNANYELMKSKEKGFRNSNV